MVRLRDLAKDVAYRTGTASAYHALRNARSLTVLMFHRVLPADELERSGADPEYTVTPEFLADCAAFLRDHYAIVSLDDVLRSQSRAQRLPTNAVLITFDDGWYDNLKYAAPALRNLPWTVFVSTDAMREPQAWWQEVLLWALRSGSTTFESLWRAAGADAKAMSDDIHSLLMRYARLDPDIRNALLEPYRNALAANAPGQMMLAPSDLKTLRDAGATIGGHGSSHLPLTLLSEDAAEADLRAARDALAPWTGSTATMSFPHGCYDERVCEAAHRAGYQLLFSSDATLNRCEDAWLDRRPLGRISVDMHELADDRGGLNRSRLATWLFLRENRVLAKAG